MFTLVTVEAQDGKSSLQRRHVGEKIIWKESESWSSRRWTEYFRPFSQIQMPRMSWCHVFQFLFFCIEAPLPTGVFLRRIRFSPFPAVLAFFRRILSLSLVAQVLQPTLQHDAHPKAMKAVSFEKKMDVWEVLVNLRESGLKNSGDLKTVHQHVALSLASVAWEELYDIENEGFVLGSDGSASAVQVKRTS